MKNSVELWFEMENKRKRIPSQLMRCKCSVMELFYFQSRAFAASIDLRRLIKAKFLINLLPRRFLDDRIFATCSDDSTVALYDTRNLKTKIRTLRGHSNWVKNIEYSKRDCLLVTSGFDGSIFTWDLNSYTENNLTYQKVFHTPGKHVGDVWFGRFKTNSNFIQD